MKNNFEFDAKGRLLVGGKVLNNAAVPYTRDRTIWKGRLHRSDIITVPDRPFHRQKRRGKSALAGVNWRNSHQILGDKFDRSNRIA